MVAVVFLGFAVLVAAAVVFFTAGSGADEGSGDGSQGGAQGEAQDDTRESGEEADGGESGGDTDEQQEDTALFGPDEALTVEVGSPQSYIDLDTDPPLVTDSRIDGYDFVLRPNINGVAFEHSMGGIAPLPEGGEAPDRAACVDAIETNEVTSAALTSGARYCLRTGEGHIAYVQAVSSPGGTGTATLQATVWE